MARITRRSLLSTGAAWALGCGLSSSAVSRALAQKADNPYGDAVLVDGEPPPIAPGSFTIAVLPDTQFYSDSYPETYLAQTEWVARNQEARRIACVLHLGDITNHNTPVEWERAQQAMNVFDGRLPYFFVAGNHDYSENGKMTDRTTLLSDYFPVSKFQGLPTFGGVYDKEPDRMENSFHLFSANGRDFLVLGLEFGPRRDVVRWAGEVAGDHPDREIILITHAYTYFDDTLHDWARNGEQQKWNPHIYPVADSSGQDVCDGQELWDSLVSRHENFIMTLNGHVLGDGLGKVITATPGGRDVAQLLVNFQMRPQGGDGWLRLMEFPANGAPVRICDYSPTRGQRNESTQNMFELPLAPVAV